LAAAFGVLAASQPRRYRHRFGWTGARAARLEEWVLTSIGWHESNLVENRLPNLAELDATALGHPVLARRGGHLAVVNSAALEAAGVGGATPDPPGGRFER
jgi:predicted amidohydrolase YtcJ